jgi:hypothetical protein
MWATKLHTHIKQPATLLFCISWSLHFWIYKLLQHYMKCSGVRFTKILFRPCYSRVANIRLSQILKSWYRTYLTKPRTLAFRYVEKELIIQSS